MAMMIRRTLEAVQIIMTMQRTLTLKVTMASQMIQYTIRHLRINSRLS
jgi:hypothetical protein